MAYLRGDFYVWGDSERMHFWVRKPEDSIDTWVHDCDFAAGVAVPYKLLDAFVEMRHAELVAEGKADKAARFAITKHPNLGSADLVQQRLGKSLGTYWAERERRRHRGKGHADRD